MKPMPIFLAAAGVLILGACRVSATDNAAKGADANSVAADESAAPATNGATGTDTLGNQLNQLQ
jgi:hypothetical protein